MPTRADYATINGYRNVSGPVIATKPWTCCKKEL
jgi:hypothetical protein